MGTAFRKERGRHGGPPDTGAIVARSSWIPLFGDTIHKERFLGSLGSTLQVKDRAGGLLGHDLFLEFDEPVEDRLGPGRAPGDVDIHRQNLVHPLDNAVHIIHPAAVGTGPHGNDPLGFRHLLEKPQDDRGDFLEHGSGNDKKVGLARGAPQDFGPETGDVVPGGKGNGLFNKTAGQPEEHGPKAVLAGPVDQEIRAAEDQVLIFVVVPGPQSRPPFLHT